MAQAKRGPKAKPKNVEPVNEPLVVSQLTDNNVDWVKRDRELRVWGLASDLLLQKAKLASALTPQAISEVARWSKQLDWELNG